MESEELQILEATLSVLGVVLFLVETLPNIVHIYQKKDTRPSLLPFACSWGGKPYGLSLLRLLSQHKEIGVCHFFTFDSQFCLKIIFFAARVINY